STGPTGWQHAAAFLPEGTLVSAGDDRPGHVWDAKEGTELAKWSGHAAPVLGLALRGGTVATGALARQGRLWGAAARPRTAVARHQGPVRALAFTKADELASSGPDGLKVWVLDAKGEKPARLTLDVPAQVVAPSPSGVLLGVEREVFALDHDSAVPIAEPGL